MGLGLDYKDLAGNPVEFLKCEYCGKSKPRVVKSAGGEIEKTLMFSQHVPYHSTNPILESFIKSRQIWLCIDCFENIG